MPVQEEIDEVKNGILSLENTQDENLKELVKKATLTTEEASKVLTEA